MWQMIWLIGEVVILEARLTQVSKRLGFCMVCSVNSLIVNVI